MSISAASTASGPVSGTPAATVAGPFAGPVSGAFAAAGYLAAGLPAVARLQGAARSPRATTPALHDHVLSLGQHLRQCQHAQGRWFGLGRLGHELHAWVAPRFVTTLAGASVLIALACLF